jgi:hypothetical protein
MSFKVLEMDFEALELSFEVAFAGKWLEKVSQGWVMSVAKPTTWVSPNPRRGSRLNVFFFLSHFDLVWLFSLLIFAFFLN